MNRETQAGVAGLALMLVLASAVLYQCQPRLLPDVPVVPVARVSAPSATAPILHIR